MTGRNSAVQAAPGSPLGKCCRPIRWTKSENVAWKLEVPGHGWSCPIVIGGKRLRHELRQRRQGRRPKDRLLRSDGLEDAPGRTPVDCLCLDAATGKIIWESVAHKGVPQAPDSCEGELCIGNTSNRWRAGLRLLRQCRHLLLRHGRQSNSGRSRGTSFPRSSDGEPVHRRYCMVIASMSSTTTRRVPTSSRWTNSPARRSGRSTATKRATGPRRSSGRVASEPRSSRRDQKGSFLRSRWQIALGTGRNVFDLRAVAGCRARTAHHQFRLRVRPPAAGLRGQARSDWRHLFEEGREE